MGILTVAVMTSGTFSFLILSVCSVLPYFCTPDLQVSTAEYPTMILWETHCYKMLLNVAVLLLRIIIPLIYPV